MKDTICKARRLDNGEWITGYFVKLKSGSVETCRIYTGPAEVDTAVEEWYPTFYEVEPDTVCASTGMTDSKGNLIFENDFLMYDYSKRGNQVKSKVVYHPGQFQCVDSAYRVMSLNRVVDCDPWNSTEVVGNYFDDYKIDTTKYRGFE